MARSYVKKKSDYWNKFEETNATIPHIEAQLWKPETAGDPFYMSSSSLLAHTAKASFGGRSSASSTDSTGQRVNAAALVGNPDRFSCIRAGLLPYRYSRDCVDVRDAIGLCQKAHANVAVFRNAISLMAEMANSDVFFEAGTKKSRDLFSAWAKRIKLGKVAAEFFLEFYRSSNVFIYRIEAPIPPEEFNKLTQIYASDGEVGGDNKVPVRYILLNPYDVVSKAATAFAFGQYEKILSKYELQRLQNPQTDEDKQIAESLPKEAKDALKNKSYVADGVRVQLDPKMLITSFYAKQDYEPFAVPFGFPVLDDINAKLELKKMDQAILRTVENAILLITMGAKPDEGGINQANLVAMQNLFKNESVGRVLISDWTTKAEFIIPDLKKVLGPEKYATVNQDIQDGLSNILVGEDKFGNTQVKMKVFIQKLEVARKAFLEDFLQPEIQRIAKNLGMRKYPVAKFSSINPDDPTQLWKTVTRMMELGLIDAASGLDAMRNGAFPDPDGEEFISKQQQYVKERGQGLWNPLAPVAPLSAPAPKLDPNVKYQIDNAPTPAGPSSTKKGSAKKPKTMKQAGKPSGNSAKASVTSIQQTVYAAESLLSTIESSIKAKHSITELSENQKSLAESLMRSVVCAAEKNDWESTALACIQDNTKMLSLDIRPEILDLASEFELETYDAALLFFAQD
jgi:hypothetical protein